MLWDTHLHTHFSGDSEASPESMIEKAMEIGLSGICITDHLDFDYPAGPGEDPEIFNLDLIAYTSAIKQLRHEYASIFPVCFGVELGLQPHLAEQYRQIVKTQDFDFVIGSSHVVHGIDPYYAHYYDGRTEIEAYREYFESILENISYFDNFDVYGHLDYVVRYGPNKNAQYSYEKYREVIDEILRLLISKNKGIEVNTGGFKYGLGQPNPCADIIKRYRELGGEIITIGADAHRPSDVAYDFHKIPDLLRNCGFEYYTVFQNRKPDFIKLG